MKYLKVLMGVFFALWLVAMLPFIVKQLVGAVSVADFAIHAAVSLVVVYIFVMFSFWSFQSAFKKPMPQGDQGTGKQQTGR